MANAGQLSILKQGVEVWNGWRAKNIYVYADLNGADLNGMDLGEADLRIAHFRRANLYRANLSGADLSGADLSDAGGDVRGLVFSGNGDANSPEECVRHFKRRGFGDVEAIDEAVADQIEVAGDRRACLAAERAQARKHLRGVVTGSEDLAGLGIFGERRLQAHHLVRTTRRYLCRTAHQVQQIGVRQARPVPDMSEEIPGWKQCTGGEAHVLGEHG